MAFSNTLSYILSLKKFPSKLVTDYVVSHFGFKKKLSSRIAPNYTELSCERFFQIHLIG